MWRPRADYVFITWPRDQWWGCDWLAWSGAASIISATYLHLYFRLSVTEARRGSLIPVRLQSMSLEQSPRCRDNRRDLAVCPQWHVDAARFRVFRPNSPTYREHRISRSGSLRTMTRVFIILEMSSPAAYTFHAVILLYPAPTSCTNQLYTLTKSTTSPRIVSIITCRWVS